MAQTVESSGTAAEVQDVSSITMNPSVSGTNRLIVAAACTYNGGTETYRPMLATCDGNAMTAFEYHPEGASETITFFYYVQASASNPTVIIQTTTGGVTRFSAGYLVMTGATELYNLNGHREPDIDNPSIDVTAAAGETVLGVLFGRWGLDVVSRTRTNRFGTTVTAELKTIGDTMEASAGTNNVGWVMSASDSWASAGMAIRGVAQPSVNLIYRAKASA